MPRRGRKRRKNRTHVQENEAAQSALKTDEESKVPKSLVIRRGKTSSQVADLVDDLRQMMRPFTALKFNEDPKNRKLTLTQYTQHLALPLGVTHILSLSQNDERLNLRLVRTPEGPTLSFRVHQFSLVHDIKALQKRPVAFTQGHASHPPIVVTNNFGSDDSPHIKLLRITFQNLFPAINVATVKLSDCRRVVLFNLVEEDIDGKTCQIVQVRHYAIRATPVGVHRRVRRIIQTNKKLPNLNKCADIADYLDANLASDAASDSEAEEDERVVLPDHYTGKGNHKSQTSALKLVELGPRLSMQLIKVEKGLGAGDVLYHAFVHKTPQEALELKKRKQDEYALKQQRKAEQEANVERKRKAMEEKRAKKRKRKEQVGQKSSHDDDDDEEEEDEQQQEEDSESEDEE